jgi:hypothetical protein
VNDVDGAQNSSLRRYPSIRLTLSILGMYDVDTFTPILKKGIRVRKRNSCIVACTGDSWPPLFCRRRVRRRRRASYALHVRNPSATRPRPQPHSSKPIQASRSKYSVQARPKSGKLAAEFVAGQSKADVLLIADAASMEALKRDGRLLPYPEAKVAGFEPAPTMPTRRISVPSSSRRGSP